MKRRDLLTWGPYSVMIAGGAFPLAAQITPSTRVREQMDGLSPATSRRGQIAAEPNMKLVELKADLLVAGGGLAGVCAAVSAARHGAKVILIQDRSRLGGNSSSEVKMHVVGASSHKGRPGWREGGLIEEIRLDDAANNPHRSWELWDLLLYDKVVSEPNITLLLETTLYSAEMKNGAIRTVMARCDKSEHLYRIDAKLFIDATGDSRLGLESGAEMTSGREPKSQYGESLAIEKPDGKTLGSSILFTSRVYPREIPFVPPAWARKVTKEQMKFRATKSWEYGYWWIEWGGGGDIIGDNERIRFELLSIVMGVWDYIKNSGEFPESRNYGMDWVGMMPGKRGSRRILGDHVVTELDLLRGTFDDAIAMGGWPLDDHTGMDFDHSDRPPYVSIKLQNPYNLPLRALYSKNVKNLMMAGRNISCSHVAFTSTRVMATCAVIGQATGTAAALCIEKGKLPRDLANDKKLVGGLQQRLLRDDQSLIGVPNADPSDLARKSTVKASGEVGDEKAMLVLNGVTRDIPKTAINHWAAPLEGDGAWIELTWDKPQKLSEVQITFDTGFQRELTLTSSDEVNRGIIRAPQPETVRDYTIYADGKELARITGNYRRLRRHKFPAVDAKSLRIHVTKINGADTARVFEVRCYA